MKNLLIHGCYDQKTMATLKDLGISHFAFDLRGRSSNLVAFRDLKLFLETMKPLEIFLVFENDKKETILSFLNLLLSDRAKKNIILRDQQGRDFYESLGIPFYWMFHPEADWKSILELDLCQGVFIPIKFQSAFKGLTEFWKMAEERKLKIFVHGHNFSEVEELELNREMNLSIELGPEVELSYRNIDQDKLKKMSFWDTANEHFNF